LKEVIHEQRVASVAEKFVTFSHRQTYIGKMMTEDMELVREYARRHSEDAFATLVSRYVNLVYSVALRQLRDASLAQEVTQATFIILARKAGSLEPKTILSAWLCRTAQYAAANALRSERRRQGREQEIYMQSMLNQPESETSPWAEIAPLLDIAMAGLGEKDHSAIVLRFFEGKDLKQVGAALGVNENTAKTRVSRAVEKLRKFFVKRGVNVQAAVLTAGISANSVQAAPVALAKSVTAVAIAKGAAASSSTLTLIKGTLKLMAWTKLKTSVVAVAAVLLAVAGTTTLSFKVIAHYREEAVWASITHVVDVATLAPQIISRSHIQQGKSAPNLLSDPILDPLRSDIQQVQSVSNMVSIRHTQFASKIDDGFLQNTGSPIRVGIAMPAGELFARAYGINRVRIVNPEALPPGKYDFVVNVTNRPKEALQTALKEKFGLTALHVMRETNVLLLTPTPTRAEASGWHPGSRSIYQPERFFGKGTPTDGHILYHNADVNGMAGLLEHHLGIPVINQTEIRGLYTIQLDDDQTPDLQTANQFLLDQFGLQLTPATQTIDMLMLQKVK
jgi:uncharacterized protein (TIGR03435 family)